VNPSPTASPGQTKATAHLSVGGPLTEKQKIAALLDVVEKSKATFIRNDQEYPPAAARQLMEYKLNKAGEQIKTAQEFIEQLATRSSTTGRIYQIKLADGRITESAFWLRARLVEIERRAR
jgi:hypothetical protein